MKFGLQTLKGEQLDSRLNRHTSAQDKGQINAKLPGLLKKKVLLAMVIAKKTSLLAKVVDLMVERMLPKVKRIKVFKTKVKGMKIPMLMVKVMVINRPQVPSDAIRWCMSQVLTQRCLCPEPKRKGKERKRFHQTSQKKKSP
ncbi:uncharacterized protein LOC121382855 [Gigantopelta aegis]|uniref:uncharacterized protein LOC121382855 n=1 Tax=Gigantopelta aegis TaxID=1735272 RepID=UPI001B88ADF5|nr:uncharacterized protein LOC121382855 [Gigantopelta aegis]